MLNIEELKYPIGKPFFPEVIRSEDLISWKETIKQFPNKVKNEIKDLSEEEISMFRYREGGWNIKQVINHCIDSHMNSFIRFKLALTEENPIIKPYTENLWGELTDSVNYKLEDSLTLLSSLHKRWSFLLESLTDNDFERTFIHPEGNELIDLKTNLSIYSWHCNHHLAHIQLAKKYKF